MNTSQSYTQYFEIRKKQYDGTEFSCLTDNAPQSLKDFVRHVHREHFYDVWPNDWIYATIHQAFDDLEENPLEDITIEPDMYNNQLYKWLYENGNAFAASLVEEYIEEFGEGLGVNLVKLISGGQWLAMDKIYRAVNEFLKNEKED